MKNGMIIFVLIVLMAFSQLFFISCGTNQSEDSDSISGITEIRASGYKKEITVGEAYTSGNIRVERKMDDGGWRGVLKDLYTIECDYDGTSYGEFELRVFLNNDHRSRFTDTITVNPKLVEIPTFSNVYSGQLVNIYDKFQSISQGLYTITSYSNQINTGEYSVILKLNNPKEYMWVDRDGNTYKNSAVDAYWSITKAPSKEYQGTLNLSVSSGDTLYTISENNNLNDVYWQIDEYTIITESVRVQAIYNVDPMNYEDTILFFNLQVVD